MTSHLLYSQPALPWRELLTGTSRLGKQHRIATFACADELWNSQVVKIASSRKTERDVSTRPASDLTTFQVIYDGLPLTSLTFYSEAASHSFEKLYYTILFRLRFRCNLLVGDLICKIESEKLIPIVLSLYTYMAWICIYSLRMISKDNLIVVLKVPL